MSDAADQQAREAAEKTLYDLGIKQVSSAPASIAPARRSCLFPMVGDVLWLSEVDTASP